MLSLHLLPARGARSSLCAQCLRLSRTSTVRAISTTRRLAPLSSQNTAKLSMPRRSPNCISTPISFANSRQYTSSTTPNTADEILAQLQDQYATARDEFEIATEETEKKTTYAEGDREAAREELDKLKEMFEDACKGEFGEEVQRRVGGRIRELDAAVVNLERSAVEDH